MEVIPFDALCRARQHWTKPGSGEHEHHPCLSSDGEGESTSFTEHKSRTANGAFSRVDLLV